jgi:peptidyl-prolyl cis-trans isomerase A (cyclophilin A)
MEDFFRRNFVMNIPSTSRRWLARTTSLALLAMLPAFATAQTAQTRVKVETSLGDVVLELNADKAPKTVDNFLQYVKAKHYDGTVFHRVIEGFMIQGGGYTKDMWEKPTRPAIPLEAGNGLTNDRGTVAMARTSDPNSAKGQFFINVVDNAGLNAPKPDGHGYAVFGKVVSGMDVVDKIRVAPTGNKGMFQNVPNTPILINSITVLK